MTPVEAASLATGISTDLIISRSRQRYISDARRIALCLHVEQGQNIAWIAKRWGIDRSAIYYAVKKSKEMCDVDRGYRTNMIEARKMVGKTCLLKNVRNLFAAQALAGSAAAMPRAVRG
jgi:transposase